MCYDSKSVEGIMKRLLLITTIFSILAFVKLNDLFPVRIVEKDTSAPVIIIKENNIRAFVSEKINYFDYVDASDDSCNYKLSIINPEDAYCPGNKIIHFKAVDPSGNSSYANLKVNIISDEKWNEEVNSKTYNFIYRRKENDGLLDIKGNPDIDAFNLAKNFIGMRGACNEVAQAFINEYFGPGYSVFNTYNVSLEDAKPGDVIYYTNGGIGLQHYAVYLGGASALQGNINGTTVIGNVYMSHGSTPQFKRIIGIE